MLVSDILEHLAYGELAHLSIGGDDTQTVTQPDQYVQVIPAINAALDALHARFELRFSNVLLKQVSGVTTYHLKSDYALSTISTKPNKYIIDSSSAPFTDDIIRIDRVVDACNKPVFINNESFCSSVMLPSFNTIEFPETIQDTMYNVIYQAKHPKIRLEGDDIEGQEINLPIQFTEALLAYIGHRIYKNRKSLAGESQSNNYYSIYQNECARLESKDTINLISKEMKNTDEGWC